MSNISVNTITDASGGSTASINGLTPQASNMQPFNRIINGAMTIDQRNAGAAVSANGAYPTDRWQLGISGGTWSVQQSSTAPEGFSKSMGITITTGYTKSVSDQNNFRQYVEGNNLSDADFGLSSAKSLTLSFWVRSSLTGTFSGSAMNSAYDRSYVFTYSISSANTWEYKTITIAGDTSGTWLTTTGVGLRLFFDLGSGSNSESASGSWLAGEYRRVAGAVDLVGTSGATFYITGVQLEAGSTASPFAHENYGDTLQKCQRYYEKSYSQSTAVGTATEINAIWGSGQTSTGTTGEIGNVLVFKVVKRASATLTFYDSVGASGKGNRILFGTGNTAGQTLSAYHVGDASAFVNSSGVSANVQEFHYTASAEL